MTNKLRTCYRCRGQTFVYREGSAYTVNNCGGKKVTCPLCVGKGQIPTLQEIEKTMEKEKVQNDEKEGRAKSTSRGTRKAKEKATTA